jgi:hypothetical protein
VDSAESSLSDARTALLAADLATTGRTFEPLTSVQLQDAADGAASTFGTFATIQPPDAASDRLRADLLPLLDRTAALIADMRIAARRADAAGVGRVSPSLATVADELERFAQAHR